ncbi:unnamed protein product [Prunus armeniaca]
MNVTNRGDKRSRILKIPRNGSPCRMVLLLKLQNAYIKCFTCISDAHRQRAIVEAVGPTMENISGPNRHLALYFASAIAMVSRKSGSAMSYWFSEAPAVGASGAVFGLVGSLAVFVMRHRGLVGRGKEDLQHIAHAMGFFFKGIDNWGHKLGALNFNEPPSLCIP